MNKLAEGSNEWFDHSEKTGEWWCHPWWEDESYAKHTGYSLLQIRSAIAILKGTFTAAWALEQMNGQHQKNIMLRKLIYHGTPALRFLVQTANMIDKLKSSTGFPSVLKRLKSNEIESAYMELQMAFIFCERGIGVEFPVAKPKKGKTPDILARCSDGLIAIECKRLDFSQREIFVERLLEAASNAAREHQNGEFKIQLVLTKRLPCEQEQLDKIIACVVTVLNAELKQIAGSFMPTFEFTIPCETVKGEIVPNKSGGKWSVSIQDTDEATISRRIMENGLSKAAEQLPKDKPGIVAVYSHYLPDLAYARDVFDKVFESQRDDLQHVTALIIFSLQTIFQRTPPLLLENKYSSVPFADIEASLIIREALTPTYA